MGPVAAAVCRFTLFCVISLGFVLVLSWSSFGFVLDLYPKSRTRPRQGTKKGRRRYGQNPCRSSTLTAEAWFKNLPDWRRVLNPPGVCVCSGLVRDLFGFPFGLLRKLPKPSRTRYERGTNETRTITAEAQV